MGAMFILFSQDMWNNLLWPLIVMRSDNHFPLAVGIASMVNVHKPEYDLLMAAPVLATLPVLILFLFFQRQFITGMTATGCWWKNNGSPDLSGIIVKKPSARVAESSQSYDSQSRAD